MARDIALLIARPPAVKPPTSWRHRVAVVGADVEVTSPAH